MLTASLRRQALSWPGKDFSIRTKVRKAPQKVVGKEREQEVMLMNEGSKWIASPAHAATLPQTAAIDAGHSPLPKKKRKVEATAADETVKQAEGSSSHHDEQQWMRAVK